MRLVNQGSRLIGQPSIHPALQLYCLVICSPRCWLGNKAVAFDGKFSHFESWLNLEIEMIWLELNVTSNNEGNLFVCFPRLCIVYFSVSSNQSRPDAAVMQDQTLKMVWPGPLSMESRYLLGWRPGDQYRTPRPKSERNSPSDP